MMLYTALPGLQVYRRVHGTTSELTSSCPLELGVFLLYYLLLLLEKVPDLLVMLTDLVQQVS